MAIRRGDDTNEVVYNDEDTKMVYYVQNFTDPEDLRCMPPEALLELLEEETNCPITYLIWRSC